MGVIVLMSVSMSVLMGVFLMSVMVDLSMGEMVGVSVAVLIDLSMGEVLGVSVAVLIDLWMGELVGV